MAAPALGLPKIIGHRGAAATAPENTLAGLRRAHRLGAAWVEFDVKLTADGRCILMHDDTLDRTTNGSGPVAAASYDEIRQLDAGSWFDGGFAGEKVPSLEEAFALCDSLSLGCNIEIKPCPGREAATAERVVVAIQAHWPLDKPLPLVSSFNRESLMATNAAAPDFLPLGHLVQALSHRWREEAEELGCSAIHCDHRRLTRADVKEIKGSRYPVLVYTVNDGARARELFDWGVDAVLTDVPDVVRAFA